MDTLEKLSADMWDAFINGRFDIALKMARHICQFRPNHGRALVIKSVIAWRQGEQLAGLDLIKKAVKVSPDDVEVLKHAGRQHVEAGFFDEGLQYYAAAADLKPNIVNELDLALYTLICGKWELGWQRHEVRVPRLAQAFGLSLAKQFNGTSVERLLVHHEGGFGDVFLFARYIPYLRRFAKYVTFFVPPGTRDVMEPCDDVEYIEHQKGMLIPSHDAWLLGMSLPYALGIPEPLVVGRYLRAPERVVAGLEGRQPGKLRIGLCWGGNPNQPRDALRTLPADQLIELTRDRENVQWVVVQVGPHARLRPVLGSESIVDPILNDWGDTAAVVMDCDLVITTDTSMVHLTGGLGVESWVLVSTVPDMRYVGRDMTTPWYEQHWLYRQPKPGQWGAAISKLKFDLSERTKGFL